MKHLKVYEDIGFDRPTIHEDDDLFDEIVEQIGTNIINNSDKKYWSRDSNNRQDEFHIRWKYNEPLDLEELNYKGDPTYVKYDIVIKKISKELKNILDSTKPDKYSCRIGDTELDVSEEKIKDFFEKLELLDKQRSIESSKKYKDQKKIATFDALRDREHKIISKDANKYNI
jgi:hypothetical protein